VPRIDLDVAAAEIEARRPTWTAAGFDVGALTWRDSSMESNQPNISRSDTSDPRSLGVRCVRGPVEFTVVLFYSPEADLGWADVTGVDFATGRFEDTGPEVGDVADFGRLLDSTFESWSNPRADVLIHANPVVLVEGADVNVFASIGSLLGYVEAIDVRDGVFQAFDATGRAIQLAATSDRGPVTYTLGTVPEPELLRGLLAKAAKAYPQGRLDLNPEQLDGASLDELLTALLPKPSPRRRWRFW
jgi:hypothetical protein